MAKEKEVKEEVTIESLKKQVDGLCAEVRRHSKNWVEFSKVHIGRPESGKKQGQFGRAPIGSILLVLGVSLMLAFGAGEIENWSQGTGTARLNQTDRTGDITLEIDVIQADTFSEDTSGAGVIIDNDVKIKDGDVLFEGTVTSEPWVGAPLAVNPASWYTYSDDFFTAGYLANAATTNLDGLVIQRGGKFSEVADHGAWLVTVVDGGGDNGETITIRDDAAGGILRLNANDNAADSVQIQLNGEAIAVTATKDLWYETRISVEDVSTNAVFAGLTVADTDILGSLGNDFMGFHLDGTSSNLTFKMGKDGVLATNVLSATMADATFYRLGFYADGSASNVYVYVDGVCKATNSASGKMPIDEVLSPAFATQTGDTGADYLDIDYVVIKAQR